MGDNKRGPVFASWVCKNFPNINNILDIAGGKGQVARKLANKKRNVCVIDAKPRFEGRHHPKIIYKSRWFSENININYKADLVIGMHPDDATGEIIRYAIKHHLPFAVVPCCIRGRDSTNIPNFKLWVDHLSRIAKKAGYNVSVDLLKMQGKNIVIKGIPPKITGK